ncbi:MAG: hypothetical protein WBP41_11885 [Saprospiraceae bacterium]
MADLTSVGQRVTNYTILTIAVTCSFLEVYTFDFYPKESYDKTMDSFKLFAPGLLFSYFIVFLQKSNLPTVKLILFFCVLEILYYASLVTGLSSWGVGVPFAGGIGALLIRKLFYQKAKLFDSMGIKYLLVGFISALAGLVFYYFLQDVWTNGVGFGLILITWQLAFGLLWIRQVERDSII